MALWAVIPTMEVFPLELLTCCYYERRRILRDLLLYVKSARAQHIPHRAGQNEVCLQPLSSIMVEGS